MTKKDIIKQIKIKKSFLCIGLDTDLERIPKHLLQYEDPIFEFNKQIIDSTKDFCVAFKINTAFYESFGSSGWNSMEKTLNYIPENILRIADAKRGDIGNTSKKYAEAFFKNLNFDAITLSAYMGIETLTHYNSYENKWCIILALTSNSGSSDFQTVLDKEGAPLYERVIKSSLKLNRNNNIMFVVGATNEDNYENIRKIAPDNFLLVPGVGAQGGNLETVSNKLINKDCGIL
ncbi:MAG: orotidine-5'-phosphate decarboxylase, partial [Flavobacteriales bacterium TMED84]